MTNIVQEKFQYCLGRLIRIKLHANLNKICDRFWLCVYFLNIFSLLPPMRLLIHVPSILPLSLCFCSNKNHLTLLYLIYSCLENFVPARARGLFISYYVNKRMNHVTFTLLNKYVSFLSSNIHIVNECNNLRV